MDGAQFAKMLSDKHLFELDRMEYKYSTVSVKEFAELLQQNFAQPLPLTDFSGNKLFYLPNLAQISTNGMKQLLSVPVSGQNFSFRSVAPGGSDHFGCYQKFNAASETTPYQRI